MVEECLLEFAQILNQAEFFQLGDGRRVLGNLAHEMMTLHVLGDLKLEFDDPKFFYDDEVYAFLVGTSDFYDVTIDGFFASDGPTAPLAAGLAYTVYTPSPIIGVAGFGLDSVQSSPEDRLKYFCYL